MRIEVRPGEGGEDAARFADEISEALLRYARVADSTALLSNRVIETLAEE